MCTAEPAQFQHGDGVATPPPHVAVRQSILPSFGPNRPGRSPLARRPRRSPRGKGGSSGSSSPRRPVWARRAWHSISRCDGVPPRCGRRGARPLCATGSDRRSAATGRSGREGADRPRDAPRHLDPRGLAPGAREARPLRRPGARLPPGRERGTGTRGALVCCPSGLGRSPQPPARPSFIASVFTTVARRARPRRTQGRR